MKLGVGETCVLSSQAVLWVKYPNGLPEDGQSYRSFDIGDTLTIVGEHTWAGRFFSYVMDCAGNMYVSPSEYLSLRVRVMR